MAIILRSRPRTLRDPVRPTEETVLKMQENWIKTSTVHPPSAQQVSKLKPNFQKYNLNQTGTLEQCII